MAIFWVWDCRSAGFYSYQSARLPACLVDLACSRSSTVCFVFGLCLDFLSPWRGFLPRLTTTPSPPSLSASCFFIFRVNLCLQTWFGFNSNPSLRKTHVLCLFFVFFLCVFRCNMLQCAGFDSAHASRNMRMFLFVSISIVVLAIGLLCPFYVPIPHTGGLSVHLLLCRTPFTRATFLCMACSKNLGSHTASV